MRTTQSLRALLVSSLLRQVSAQAPEYGLSDSTSDGDPSGHISEGSSAEPSCIREGTTTIFVTVPASATSGSGNENDQDDEPGSGHTVYQTIFPSDAALSSFSSSHGTSVGPFLSAGSPDVTSAVKPFTTLTLDIWGTGYGTGGESDNTHSPSPTEPGSVDIVSPTDGSGHDTYDSTSGDSESKTSADGSSSDNPATAISDGETESTNSSQYHTSEHPPASNSEHNTDSFPTDYGTPAKSQTENSGEGSTAPNTSADVDNDSPRYTFVTDTDVYWTTGPHGPSQVTVVSSHTIFYGTAPTVTTDLGGPEDSTFNTQTIIGLDGKPTVIIFSGNDIPETGSVSLPSQSSPEVTAITPGSLPTISWSITEGASGDESQGSESSTCATLTIIGSDGLPTVIESTWDIPPSHSPTADTTVITGWPISIEESPPYPFSSILGSPSASDGAITTQFSFTFTGVDGKATVVETSLVVVPTQEPSDSDDTSDGQSSVYGDVATSYEFTVTGSNRVPTVIQTTVIAAPSMPTSGADLPPPSGSGAGESNSQDSLTCTKITILGPDGRPTVMEATWTNSAIANTEGPFPWEVPVASGLPSGPPFPWEIPSVSALTSGPQFPWEVPGASGVPSEPQISWTGPGLPPQITAGSQTNDITTCTSFTMLGQDGLPTVYSATWSIAGPQTTQSGLPSMPGIPSDLFPSEISSQISDPPFTDAQDTGARTTCTSYTLLGADGMPTVVEATWTVPNIGNGPTSTSLDFPSMVPPVEDLPQGVTTSAQASSPITTSFTALVVGPDGTPTPVVQTVILTPNIPVITNSNPTLPPFSSTPNDGVQDFPSLTAYGGEESKSVTFLPPFIPNPSPAISNIDGLTVSPITIISTTVIGALTTTFTLMSFPGGPIVPQMSGIPSYGSLDGNNDVFPGPGDSSGIASGALPTDVTLWPSPIAYNSPSSSFDPASVSSSYTKTTLQTSTWTNLIPEQTTTYTINYPLTTLATIIPPVMTPVVKRPVRRQYQHYVAMGAPWSNSSTSESLPSPSAPASTVSVPVSTMCATGGDIGNHTLDFDDIQPGPLYNPARGFWFSEGFSVVPPSPQLQSFVATSGSHLAEFVPTSSSSIPSGGSGDIAEIGVGPHFSIPCFKFNLYGANLGCAATSNEQWCEFDISAYTYDETTGSTVSAAWSETKRVPACSTYPSGTCSLTPIELEGYNNITSVLIALRVGLDLRVWWLDDLRVGWNDNSCEAASCRGRSSTVAAKTRLSSSTLRRHIFNLLSSFKTTKDVNT